MRRFRRRDHRGQTLVEFALILPIFILVLIGIFDFGRAVYAYNTISNAARQAVRVAIVNQDTTTITDTAVNDAASLGLDASDISVSFLDLDTNTTYTTCPALSGCVEGWTAIVTVTYQYRAATPIISNLVGTIDMSATSNQPIEFNNP